MERRNQTRKVTISGRRRTDMTQGVLNQRFIDEIEALKKNDEETKEQNSRNHEEVMTLLKEYKQTLAPISETYNTATRMGKWFMGLAVFISVSIGIIVGLQKIFHK